MPSRSQRHLRYRDGIDSRGDTAMARQEPSMVTQAVQRARALVRGGRPPAANTVAPAITGTLTVTSILTVTNGTWTSQGAPTYTRQWYRGNLLIAGATALTYTLAAADVGFKMRVVVKSTDSYGISYANSNITGTVA